MGTGAASPMGLGIPGETHDELADAGQENMCDDNNNVDGVEDHESNGTAESSGGHANKYW